MFSRLPFVYLFYFVIGLGTLFSISSSQWLGVWAGLEINLIGFLPLLVYQKRISERESGVKYFIVQALGSSLLIFGRLAIYSMSFTWETVGRVDREYLIPLFLIVSGLCIKIGLFPFHFWLPSVIAGLPWIRCLLLATWQKIAPLFLISSVFDETYIYWFAISICLMAASSRLIGGIGGINQTQVRALLAYSSIGHLGWIVFAILQRSWAIKTYFIIYVLISFCVFISLWYRNFSFIKNSKSLVRLRYLSLPVLIILLSLAGLPPLLGFIPKWRVIVASISIRIWIFVFILMAGSLISLFYYLSLFFSLGLGIKMRIKLIKEKNFSIILLLGLFINILGGVPLITAGVTIRLYALIIFYEP